MAEVTIKTYLILCPLIFFAGFVDSIAGGGGLITIPAYILAGAPVHLAQGTNKMVNSFGLTLSAVQYGRGGFIRLRPALVAAAGSALGGVLGARAILMIPGDTAQLLVMVCLPFAALFMLTRKRSGSDTDNIVAPKIEYIRGFFIGLGSGFYAGAFGPGGGTIMMMLFSALLGYSMITSAANAKAVNLASDFGAFVTFAASGQVSLVLGVPCILCSCLGNYIGSKTAMKKGGRFIRPVMIAVMAAVFVKVAYDFMISR